MAPRGLGWPAGKRRKRSRNAKTFSRPLRIWELYNIPRSRDVLHMIPKYTRKTVRWIGEQQLISTGQLGAAGVNGRYSTTYLYLNTLDAPNALFTSGKSRFAANLAIPAQLYSKFRVISVKVTLKITNTVANVSNYCLFMLVAGKTGVATPLTTLDVPDLLQQFCNPTWLPSRVGQVTTPSSGERRSAMISKTWFIRDIITQESEDQDENLAGAISYSTAGGGVNVTPPVTIPTGTIVLMFPDADGDESVNLQVAIEYDVMFFDPEIYSNEAGP